jgi:hypothetical protein
LPQEEGTTYPKSREAKAGLEDSLGHCKGDAQICPLKRLLLGIHWHHNGKVTCGSLCPTFSASG